jgi:hypothetical protein
MSGLLAEEKMQAAYTRETEDIVMLDPQPSTAPLQQTGPTFFHDDWETILLPTSKSNTWGEEGAASLYHELFEQSSIEMEGTGTHLEYLKSSIDLLNEPSTNLRMNDWTWYPAYLAYDIRIACIWWRFSLCPRIYAWFD